MLLCSTSSCAPLTALLGHQLSQLHLDFNHNSLLCGSQRLAIVRSCCDPRRVRLRRIWLLRLHFPCSDWRRCWLMQR